MNSNSQALQKLRYAAALLTVAAVLVTWSDIHERSPLEMIDVILNSFWLLMALAVIWLQICHSPFRQLYWGWAFLIGGGFSILFFMLITILTLRIGDGSRIVLGGLQSATACCSFLGGWLLVFDKDIKAWRQQLKAQPGQTKVGEPVS